MMKRTGMILIHTVAIASLTMSVAMAQGPGGHGGPPRGAPGAIGQVLRGFLQALPPQVAEQLDITSAQQAQIETIQTAERAGTKSDSQEMRSLGDEGRKLALSKSFTASAASEIALKEATEAETLVLATQKAKGEIVASVLTSAQRTQLATLEANAPTHMRGAPPVDRIIDMLTDQLDLTDDQQTSITDILRSAATSQADDVKAVAAAWASYESAHSDGTYEESALKAAYASVEPSIEDYLTTDLKTQNAIWSALTDAQKTQFQAASSHGPGAPPPGGGPGGPGNGADGGPHDQGGMGDQGGPPRPDDQ